MAELADAQDLKSCCSDTVPVRFRSPAFIQNNTWEKVLWRMFYNIWYVCVAQLDRALGYGPRCRGFESSHARWKKPWKLWVFKAFLYKKWKSSQEIFFKFEMTCIPFYTVLYSKQSKWLFCFTQKNLFSTGRADRSWRAVWIVDLSFIILYSGKSCF